MLHKLYTPKILEQAKKVFESQGFIQLQQILTQVPAVTAKKQAYKPLDGIYTAGNAPNISKDVAPVCKALNIPTPKRWEVRSFSKGNYCMNKLVGNTAIIFDCTKDWDDSVGGVITFQTKDGEAILVPPAYNALTIVKAKNMRSFVTYVNHHAGTKKRVFLIGITQ